MKKILEGIGEWCGRDVRVSNTFWLIAVMSLVNTLTRDLAWAEPARLVVNLAVLFVVLIGLVHTVRKALPR